MTWEIRRIPLLSLVKVSFVVYMFLSLIIMLLYGLFIGSIASMIGGMFAEEFDIAPLTGGALLIGGLIGSVVLASIYTFFTFIAGVIYNAVASLVGGLEVELESREIMVPAPSSLQPQAAAPAAPQPVEPAAPLEVKKEAEPPVNDRDRFKPKEPGSSENWGWGAGGESKE